MGLIYYLSARPVVPHPGRAVGLSDHLVDYTAHAAIFGALMFLAWRAVRSLGRVPLGGAALFVAGAWSALYAVADEAHQSFVPGRCATLPDLLADLAGIAGAALVLRAWATLRARERVAAATGRTPPVAHP